VYSIGAGLKIYQPSDFPLPGWISSHMSSVILTDIIQTVLETSECFLSITNNNMHVLANGTEEQAVYSGHLSSKLLSTDSAAIISEPSDTGSF
jgi:hypothetical protein